MIRHYYNIPVAILILATLVVVPMFQSWSSSVIPDLEDYGTVIPEIVETFEEDENVDFKDLEISGPIVSMVFGVFFLLASFGQLKGLSIISSFAGIGWLIWAVGSIIYYNDFDTVFDFDHTAVTIGFWIVFILFIVGFTNSIFIKSCDTHSKGENDMGLISDMKKRTTSTSSATVEKNQEITATTKLDFAINEARGQIEEYYKQIGELYFEKYKDNPSAELAGLVENIKNKSFEIDKMNIQIIKLRGFTICPQCNAEVSINARFCCMCGFKIELPMIEEEQKNCCPQCGNEVRENSKFCNRCGCKITYGVQNEGDIMKGEMI